MWSDGGETLTRAGRHGARALAARDAWPACRRSACSRCADAGSRNRIIRPGPKARPRSSSRTAFAQSRFGGDAAALGRESARQRTAGASRRHHAARFPVPEHVAAVRHHRRRAARPRPANHRQLQLAGARATQARRHCGRSERRPPAHVADLARRVADRPGIQRDARSDRELADHAGRATVEGRHGRRRRERALGAHGRDRRRAARRVREHREPDARARRCAAAGARRARRARRRAGTHRTRAARRERS